MYLGIDLGTTNTVVSRSFVDSSQKLNTEIIHISQLYNDNWEKFPSLPSVIYIDTQGLIIDTKGGIIVGREAKRQREHDKEKLINNSKRFMGTKQKWNIDGSSYQAKDVAAMILQHCKKNIDREANMNYKSVVITVPASFNPEQIEDTIKAAIQAGFKEDQVVIKHEPTAALLSFIDNELNKSEIERYIDFNNTKRVLVFDIGGGTSDTSIIDVRAKDNELFFTEIGIGRYQELGGIDFDNKIANGLLNKFLRENNIFENDITEDVLQNLHYKLSLAAEVLKEKLSANIYTKISFDDNIDIDSIQAKINIPDFYEGTPYRITLTKMEYDNYTESLFNDSVFHYKKFEDIDLNKSIIGVIRKTLEDNEIDKETIDFIFLTGGMSKFITIEEKLFSYFNKPIYMPENPMEAVARGASIYLNYKISENNDEPNNTDIIKKEEIIDNMILAEAILLDMNEGLPKVIIPKKTAVPYSGEIIGEFYTTSPSGIKLNIYAGENEKDSSMRIQKSISKYFNFPVERGTPFDIKYNINENKAINITIVIHDSMNQEIDISVKSDLKIKEKDYNIAIDE